MLSSQEIIKARKYLNGRDAEFAKLFKALSDVNRCKIFRVLTIKPRLSVSSTAKVLNISLPLASQHLKILLLNGLLKKEKQGLKVYYELNWDKSVVTSLVKVIK